MKIVIVYWLANHYQEVKQWIFPRCKYEIDAFKGIVKQIEKYTFWFSCRKINDKIDTTRLEPGVGYLVLSWLSLG